jgi:hypothetical protein
MQFFNGQVAVTLGKDQFCQGNALTRGAKARTTQAFFHVHIRQSMHLGEPVSCQNWPVNRLDIAFNACDFNRFRRNRRKGGNNGEGERFSSGPSRSLPVLPA